jgi:lipoic acid synthetase
VLNHNLETISRLYPDVRPQADYQRSLHLLMKAKKMSPDLPTKSGLMLGLGESPEELRRSFSDLMEVGCQMLTLGQYLQPSREHLKVERFVPPEEFDEWREIALEMGFKAVASGPFVRSSFHAEELYGSVMPERP